jgi:hypothetical protein
MKTRLLGVVLAFAFFIACDISEIGNPGDKGNRAGTGTMDGESSTCVVTSRNAIGWEEVGSFGVSPKTAFSNFEGSCEAPFQWDGSDWSDELTVDPVSGNSSVKVTVSIDRQSAYLVEREDDEDADGLAMPCPALLEISGHVALVTDDGSLDEQQEVTITYTDSSPYRMGNSSPIIQWNITPQELNGTLDIEPANENTKIKMSFEIMPVQVDCAGRVRLSAVTDMSSGVAQGDFATWSTSGCEFGSQGLDLDEPFEGLLLADELANLWADATYEGTWDDGKSTLFDLAVTPLTQKVCIDAMSAVSIPVKVTASTSDGRIINMTGEGSARASIQNGHLSQLDLWLSEEIKCDGFFNLTDWSVDCSKVHHVFVDVSINHYLDDSASNYGQIELSVVKLAADGVSPINADVLPNTLQLGSIVSNEGK